MNENTPKYTFKQSTQVSLGLLFIEFNSMATKQKPLKTLSNLKQSNCKVYTFLRVNILLAENFVREKLTPDLVVQLVN